MRLVEEGADGLPILLEPPEMAKDDGLEVVWPSDAPLAHVMVLEVIPDQLVGIEFRRMI